METPDETQRHQHSMAQLESIGALPVEPYIGLTLAQAEARANDENRLLRLLESLEGPRHLDLMHQRLNIVLDAAGVVTAADAG